MEVRSLGLCGVYEIIPKKFADARGFLSETYARDRFREIGITQDWVQDNHSFSVDSGVLRGLHFQVSPFAQDKLIRVLSGSVFDVAVDVRKTSPTFGRWVSLTISAAAFNQMLIPKGFAHGFISLEPRTEVLYKVSAPYSKSCDRSISHADPALAIAWPLPADRRILSDKDRDAPLLASVIEECSFT